MNALLLTVCVCLALPSALAAYKSPCPAGRVRKGGTCIPCPTGTFREPAAPNLCKPCKPGTFQPIKGAIHRDLCRICAPGTFAASAGSVACRACKRGTSSGYLATKCTSCSAGSQMSYFGAYCSQCEAGFYSATRNAPECTHCPEGTTSVAGSAALKACRKCKRTDGYPCFDCQRNFFHRDSECVPCGPGSSSAPGSTRCSLCARGSFRPANSPMGCRKCPAGKISNGPGAVMCHAKNVACPSFTFANARGDCQRCADGWRLDATRKTCFKCPAGTVGKGGLSKQCSRCPKSMIPNAARSQCVCSIGELLNLKSGRCVPCPAGSYRSDYFHSFARCIPCPTGHVASSGAKTCTRCPDERVASPKADRCMLCVGNELPNPIPKLGLLTGTGHSSCVVGTTGCPVAYERVTRRGSTCRPLRCAKSTRLADMGRTCIGCGKGAVLRADGRAGCSICPNDSISDGGLATKCVKCPNGLTRDDLANGKCTCKGINALGRGLDGRGVCRTCKAGSFSSDYDSTCLQCAAGSFNTEGGLWYCRDCDGNSVADKAGATSCRPCQDGLIANAAHTACVAASTW